MPSKMFPGRQRFLFIYNSDMIIYSNINSSFYSFGKSALTTQNQLCVGVLFRLRANFS